MRPDSAQHFFVIGILLALILSNDGNCQETDLRTPVPDELRRWLEPQDWRRDTDGPVVSLGDAGQFDDTHIFAPCVGRIDGRYWMWYSGATGKVSERVFDLGLAISRNGREFDKYISNPVFQFGDGKHSVLTPTLLRTPGGAVLHEHGKRRLWFTSTNFLSGTGRHTLHETTSHNGITWSKPSAAQLENVYAPTILKEGNEYRMWYTDVSGTPWKIRLATSSDGTRWRIHGPPVLEVQQSWERLRLFYPTVVKADGVYLMWYGSYWSERANTTAIGFAASLDGRKWLRSGANPVLKPDSNRPWESHYTTSQSVIRRSDGSFRMWYASRKKPPFENKYFAINTAVWSGPPRLSDTEPRVKCQ